MSKDRIQPYAGEKETARPEKMDRRKFLQLVAKIFFGASVPLFLAKYIHDTTNNTPISEHPSLPPDFLRDSEVELSLEPNNIAYTLDGHVPYFTTQNGHRRYFISGDNGTYLLETKTSYGLSSDLTSAKPDQFSQIVGPDESIEYRNGYSALTSILPTDKSHPQHIFAVAHNEQRKSPEESGTFTATIGLMNHAMEAKRGKIMVLFWREMIRFHLVNVQLALVNLHHLS